MPTLAQTFDLALAHHRGGRLREAAALYEAVLHQAPRHAPSWHWLGVIALAENRPAASAELIRRAIELDPANPDCYNDLANALHRLGQSPEAIAAYRQALALQPDHPLARHNLAQSLLDQGDPENAIAEFRTVVEIQPDFALAHLGLASALANQQKWSESEAAVRECLRYEPDLAEAHRFLAHVLVKLDRTDEAQQSLQAALTLQPAQPEWRHELAQMLADRRRFTEAIHAEHHALQLRPGYLEALNGLALAHKALGQYDEAAAAIRRALVEQPDSAILHSNLAGIFKNQGQPTDAVAEYREAVALDPASPRLQSALIYAMYFDPASSAAAIESELQLWNERFGLPHRAAHPWVNERSPTRRLRIGYVSPDFRDHVIARNLRPLFAHHDHAAFEIFCYSGTAHPDEVTREFQAYADHWRNCRHVDDEALALTIRADAIDLLVDLSQHLPGHRLGVFARQPAPLQVSFAAYPASSGLWAIEHRLTDRHLDPPASPRSERLHYLESFWCYDPAGDEVPIGPLPLAENGHITFGNLNNFSKVNAAILQLWASVLHAVPGSHLLLLAHPGNQRDWTSRVLAEAEVEPSRVQFAAPADRAQYLAQYQQIDLVLDSFPYNGHTSSLDALWMGVPVVTLAGETSVSRAGLSQLTNLGLAEHIATTPDAFIQIASSLASDPARLAELRSTLRNRLERSVLMNALHFARQIEAAYRAIWLGWCANAH